MCKNRNEMQRFFKLFDAEVCRRCFLTLSLSADDFADMNGKIKIEKSKNFLDFCWITILQKNSKGDSLPKLNLESCPNLGLVLTLSIRQSYAAENRNVISGSLAGLKYHPNFSIPPGTALPIQLVTRNYYLHHCSLVCSSARAAQNRWIRNQPSWPDSRAASKFTWEREYLNKRR